MVSASKRAAFGCVAGVISAVTVHQGIWALLHRLNLPMLGMPPAWALDPVPPWHVPRTISLCFWCALWGIAFGLAWRGTRESYWFGGFWLGVVVVLVGFFIEAPLKGLPIAGGGHVNNWVRSILINGGWGVGTGWILSWFVGDTRPPEKPEKPLTPRAWKRY